MEKNVFFPYELTIEQMADFVRNDTQQMELMNELAKTRKMPVDWLVDRGIFVSTDYDELSFISGTLGIDYDNMGINTDMFHMYINGFLIPITDTQNRIVYYINYSYLRDSNEKYIMVHSGFVKTDREIRMYGLHNFKLAIHLGHIAVVEGAFDAIRLENYGIPVIAILGTKLTEYQKNFLSRFERITYIPDNDTSGELAYQKYKKELPNISKFEIDSNFTDVDEFGGEGKSLFNDWVIKLKSRMGIK